MTFKGRVMDEIDNRPVSSSILLLRCLIDGWGDNEIYQRIETDSQGIFEIEIPELSKYYYSYYALPKNIMYLDFPKPFLQSLPGVIVIGGDLSSGQRIYMNINTLEQNDDIKLTRISTIKLNLVNEFPFDTAKFMGITMNFEEPFSSRIGSIINDTFVYVTKNHNKNPRGIELGYYDKNSTVHKRIEGLFVKPWDTTEVTIKY